MAVLLGAGLMLVCYRDRLSRAARLAGGLALGIGTLGMLTAATRLLLGW